MSRPLKKGFGYFPKDTDFYSDDKVRIIRAEFGVKGMYLLDYLLCEVYGKDGYYLNWSESKCFLVSDGAGCGCSPQLVTEVVQGLVRCGFFDESVFNLFSVLTSAGIQRRYIRMFGSRERIELFEEYFLLDLDDKADIPQATLNKVTFKNISTTENPFKNTENHIKNTENALNKNKYKYKLKEILSSSTVSKSSLIDLPLSDNSVYQITQELYDKLLNLYPELDVMRELKMMCGWLQTHSKTKFEVERLIYSWLSRQVREVEENKQMQMRGSQNKKGKKTVTMENDHDYKSEDLERALFAKRFKEEF